MRKEFRRLLAAFLAFFIGVVGATYYHDYRIQRDHLLGRESKLHYDLFHLRRSIDEYIDDKGELPQSLDDLVRADYLHDIPYDSITYRREWRIIIGDDPNSLKHAQGIIDVHSPSSDTSSEGTQYSQW